MACRESGGWPQGAVGGSEVVVGNHPVGRRVAACLRPKLGEGKPAVEMRRGSGDRQVALASRLELQRFGGTWVAEAVMRWSGRNRRRF
jgi:hypothetical protein